MLGVVLSFWSWHPSPSLISGSERGGGLFDGTLGNARKVRCASIGFSFLFNCYASRFEAGGLDFTIHNMYINYVCEERFTN